MQRTAINQLLPIVSMPWWVTAVSQEEHVNSSDGNRFDVVEKGQKTGSLLKTQHIMGQEQENEKEAIFQLSFSAGDKKNFLKENNMHDCQIKIFQQLSPPQQKGYFELGLGQPVDYANYPLGDQCLGFFTAHGTQPMGRIMLPFSVATEGPIYVNPKQYHGILRRRKTRAKEGLKKREARDKPYLHESRHRHACRRPRGAGGRFLNTNSVDDEKAEQERKTTSDQQQTFPRSQSSGSSEVLQLENGNLNSSKSVFDCKSSNLVGSEVTSMYYNKEFDCFRVNTARPPFALHHPLSNMEGSKQGGSWVTAADGCCDFFKIC